VVSDHSKARLPDEDLWAAGLNISEIVAQKHLLARITALEIAVAALEQKRAVVVSDEMYEPIDPRCLLAEPVKRKPGRPRKNA
jgi:hypothetical protein